MKAREQLFNAEQADKREQGKPLYVSRAMRPRYDALVRALGYKPTRPGLLLIDMIEFFEATTPGERRSLLNLGKTRQELVSKSLDNL